MALVIRRRRKRRSGPSVSKWFRYRMIGLVFLAMAVIVIAAVTYLTTILPSSYIYVYNGTLGVGSTLPDGASGVDSKLIVGVIGWGVGVLLFASSIRRLGLKI